MYKEIHSFDERVTETKRITKKYPNRICVVVEKAYREKDLPELKQQKFLIIRSLTFMQLKSAIMSQMDIDKSKALFFFMDDTVISMSISKTMGEIYDEHKEDDGILYIQFISENTFG